MEYKNLSPRANPDSNVDKFALLILGKLSISGGKRFYVNGPLADVCITNLKNEGNIKVTGKLSVGTLLIFLFRR